MRSALIASVLVGWVSLAGADTPKDPKAAARTSFADGQQRYDAGDYLVAADKFEAAYALDPDPVYLFNIAQAYRFGNACAKAVASYKKFQAAVPNAPNAEKVQQYLAQSEDCAAKQAAVQRPTPPPPPDQRQVLAPPPPPERSARARGHGLVIAGIGVAGVGAIGLGLAGYFTYQAHHDQSLREGLCASEIAATQTCAWTAGKQMDAEHYEADGTAAQRNARITWAIAAPTAVAGVILLILGGRAPHEGSQVSLAPTTGGALAVGSFSF